MKLTKIIATALVALVAMTAAVSAAEPACVIDLTKEANAAVFTSPNNVEIAYDAEKGATKFTTLGGDPYVSYPLPENMQFECDTNTWCKIGYMVSGEVEAYTTQFFWKTSANNGFSGGQEVIWVQDVQKDAKKDVWCDQVIEMLPVTAGTWTGTLQTLRFDPFHQESTVGSAGGEIMWVKYIAFFASEADAQAYTFAAAPATGATTTPETGAAQTADIASVAVIGLVAAAAVVVATKKR